MIRRHKTKQINIGGVTVGGDAPIRVQSMTNTRTSDVKKTVAQIERLVEAGCELVRLSVPDAASAKALQKIKEASSAPLIADVHFNWKMAIEAIKCGADAIRINPGNIKEEDLIKIAAKAKEANIPVRVGVNAGSLEKEILKKYGHPSAKALVESALQTVSLFKRQGFGQIKISVKASSVSLTIEAYRLIAKKTDYPLHIGISEAGPLYSGTIKSAVGIGILLGEGIGDTIRVSLTADPVEEVRVAYEILKSLNLRSGTEIISCPTCARCHVDLISLASEVERLLLEDSSAWGRFSEHYRRKLSPLNRPLRVAVMGCVVNGPGEAREADVGIAAGQGSGVLFREGKIIKKIKEKDFIEELIKEVKKLR